MGRPEMLSWFGGQLQRGMSRVWQTQQRWTPLSLSARSVDSRAYYDDEKREEGLLLMSNNHTATTNTRRIPSVRQVSAFVFRSLCLLLSILSPLWYLLPRHGVPARKKAIHELHPLAYLDALRGYGALMIYTGHVMHRDWGWLPGFVANNPWLQFPFRGGNAMLDMFFWISGYVVTYRVIGFIQTKKYDRMIDAMASNCLKRYPRLFLPVIVVTFVTVVLLRLGVAEAPKWIRTEIQKGTLNLFKVWLADTAQLLDPFAHTGSWWRPEYAGSKILTHLWSINTEFRSTMMLMCFCMATCKMTIAKRKRMIWICIVACMWWEYACFAAAFCGMWFAECRQQNVRKEEAKKLLNAATKTQTDTQTQSQAQMEKHSSTGDDSISITQSIKDLNSEKGQARDPEMPMTVSSSSFPRISNFKIRQDQLDTLQRLRQPFLICMFICSFIILRNPHESMRWNTFPHNIINFITLSRFQVRFRIHIHMIIGAMMALYPIDQLAILQHPLRQPFSQYLGELSFGIYAVHWTVRWVFWESFYLKRIREHYGKDVKTTDHFFLMAPGYLTMMVIVLWAAELFRRVDMQVVKVCTALETWASK